MCRKKNTIVICTCSKKISVETLVGFGKGLHSDDIFQVVKKNFFCL